jgi:UDP-N-acetylmuramate--alanine ligase
MKGRKLHFIAIGGAGMSGLALVCHRLGAEVSGSDRAESSYLDRLRDAGLEPRLGHDPDAVPPDAEVVVSSAITDENPELRRARERGQPVLHRGELLAELCASKRLISVAGTHGKTTTAGMLAHVLRALGEDPAFFLGGELPGAGPNGEAANAGSGEGEWVVAEADESDASFLRLRPEVAVVTNVELDHHSHWGSRGELLDAFRRFAEPARGLALLDHPRLDSIAAGQRTLRFGTFALPPPLRAGREGGWDGPSDLRLALPGEHNRLNALAALAAVELAGIDVDGAVAALAGFPGMLRRLERKGERDGAVIYDDYAHHPTEIEAALAALRDLDPRRLIAVFQPHLYSRTKALAPRFGQALTAADEIGVLEVYPAREEPVGPLAGVSGLAVAETAAERAGGKPVWWLRDAERAERALAPHLREGDLLVTLGAGDIFKLADRLVEEGVPDGSSAAPAGPAGSREETTSA